MAARARLLLALFGLLASCGDGRTLPGEIRRLGRATLVRPSPDHSFWIATHEVTRAEWAEFLSQPDAAPPSWPGLRRGADGAWTPDPGTGAFPATHLTHADAQAYCTWFSRTFRVTARLPAEAEWETAARAGLTGAAHAWGWEPPEGRAAFAEDQPAETGRFAPNRAGLFDVCGGVWEWCAEPGVARGGAWSERREVMVRVDARRVFPEGYRDADAGLRVLVEASPP